MYTKFENNPSRGFLVIALTPLRAAGGGWRVAGGGRRAAGGGRLWRKTITSPDPSDTGDINIQGLCISAVGQRGNTFLFRGIGRSIYCIYNITDSYTIHYNSMCIIACYGRSITLHDDVIKWKHFPRYWPFVRGIHQSRWIPRTKASDAERWCFLSSASE